MKVGLNSTEKYQYWLNNMERDDPGYQELLTLQGKQAELSERFQEELSFGTGGLRGVIGAGSNRMNSLVVRRVSQGLANYLLKQPGRGQSGVVIAFDTRHCSEYFAKVTARTLAAAGIPVHLFDSFRPTPLLSFAVRHLKAAAGVVITASHNPPDYNGYKVYAPDGGQAVPWLAQKITAEVEKLPYTRTDQLPSYQELLNRGTIRLIGGEIDRAYLACYEHYPAFQGDPAAAEALKVVYTPLHGTGAPLVRETLERNGFTGLTLVDEQAQPDPEFSTVKSPNPEERSAFDLAVKLAIEKEADLIVATDPDCDRVGVMTRGSDGSYLFLNGNQVGALLMEYILSRLSKLGTLPADGFAVKTVVTGELGKVIAESYGLRVAETLTGFKYIGEQIELAERAGKSTFVFGYEESDGYLAAPFVRDKDGIMGVLLICRMAAHYRKQGGLEAALAKLYHQYGYYSERLLNFKEPGAEGKEKISRIMDDWRRRIQLDKSLLTGGERVKEKIDYLHDQTGLPPENSIKFILEDGSWFCLRPSGTEPKLKAYVAGRGQDLAEAKAKVAQIAKLVEGSVRS